MHKDYCEVPFRSRRRCCSDNCLPAPQRRPGSAWFLPASFGSQVVEHPSAVYVSPMRSASASASKLADLKRPPKTARSVACSIAAIMN